MMKASANILLLGLCFMSLTDHGSGTNSLENDTVVLRPKFWGKEAESIEFINPFATYMVQLEADKCPSCSNSNCSDMEKRFNFKMHFSVKGFLSRVYKLCVDFSNAHTSSCYNWIRCSFGLPCNLNCGRGSLIFNRRMHCTDYHHFSLIFFGHAPCKLTGSTSVSLKTNDDMYHLKMMNGSCGQSATWRHIWRKNNVMSHFGNGRFSQPCTLAFQHEEFTKTSFCFKFLYENFPKGTLTIFFSNDQHNSWKIFNRDNLPGLGMTHCGPYTNSKTLITLVPDKNETLNQHQLFFKFWYKRQTETETETETCETESESDCDGTSNRSNTITVVLSIAVVVFLSCCCGCLSHKRRCAKPTNVLSSTHVSHNVRDNSESVRIPEHVHTPVAAAFDSNQRTVAPPDYSTLEANDCREVPQFPTSHAAYRSPLIERQEVGEDDGPPPKYESLFPSEGSA